MVTLNLFYYPWNGINCEDRTPESNTHKVAGGENKSCHVFSLFSPISSLHQILYPFQIQLLHPKQNKVFITFLLIFLNKSIFKL